MSLVPLILVNSGFGRRRRGAVGRARAVYDEAGGQRTEFAINQLRMMQEFAQAPGLTPLSSELEEGLADVLTFAQALFGGMGDARDGFAQDIEHERN